MQGDTAPAPLAEWQAVLDGLTEAVIAVTTRNEIVYVNRAAACLLGWEESDLAGQPLVTIIPERFRKRHQHAFDAFVLGADGNLIGRPLRLPALRRDGTETPVELVISTATLSTETLFIGLLRDVTDRLEIEGPGDLADQLVGILASADVLDNALPLVLEALSNALGWQVAHLWIEANGSLRVRDAHHADAEATHPFAMASRRTFTPGKGLPGKVFASGIPMWIDDLAADPEFSRRPAAAHAGLRSGLGIPVSVSGRTIGVIELFSTDVRHVDADLVRRLSVLGHEIGPFIERRQHEEERLALGERLEAMAQTLQQSLLPPSLPLVPGVDLAGRYHGASDGMDVGGDFYDVFRTGRGSWGIVLGDVCGKGAEAAAVTALVRYTIRAAAMQTRSPGRALSLLNRAMLEQQASDPAFDRFATAVHAVIRPGPESIAVTVGCAGHLLPIVRRLTGEVCTVGFPGTLLGVLPEISVTDTDVTLLPGDAIVFYTDGVTEARHHDDEFGEEGLLALLERAQESSAAGLAELIERTALEFQRGVARDDIGVVVIVAH